MASTTGRASRHPGRYRRCTTGVRRGVKQNRSLHPRRRQAHPMHGARPSPHAGKRCRDLPRYAGPALPRRASMFPYRRPADRWSKQGKQEDDGRARAYGCARAAPRACRTFRPARRQPPCPPGRRGGSPRPGSGKSGRAQRYATLHAYSHSGLAPAARPVADSRTVGWGIGPSGPRDALAPFDNGSHGTAAFFICSTLRQSRTSRSKRERNRHIEVAAPPLGCVPNFSTDRRTHDSESTQRAA